jgi:parallel beta-helix repeat protein
MSERVGLISVRHKVAIVTVACLMSFLATLVSVPDNVLATNHGGWITSDETWTKAGNPHYIVTDVRVMLRVTLTITSGVNVSFYSGTSLYVDGDLVVTGSVSEPVRFTSNARVPSAGDWGSIHFNASAGGGLPPPGIRNAIVEYGSTAIYVDNRSLPIRDSTIRYNVIGIHSHYAAMSVQTNSIYENDNHGIEWTGLNTVISTAIIIGNNITYNGGNGINGSAGATVAIISNSVAFNTYGIHFEDSTPATSQNSVKNNSEDGIYFLRSGNGTFISNNTIANNSKNGILVNTSTVPIDNNTVDNNGLNGTYLANYDGTFENNTVQSNSGSGIESDDSSIYAYNNTMLSNGKKGLFARNCECQILENRILSNTEQGIYLDNSSSSAIDKNNVSYNSGGFYLFESANITVSRNTMWSSVATTFGIVYKSSNIAISNNTGYGGGIRVLYSDHISAWTNSIESPPFWGIDFNTCSNISLGDNLFLKTHGGYGIHFILSENITAINNTVLHRGWGDALSVQVSTNVTLQRNNISSTREGYSIGIYVGGSTNVNITDNNMVSNHDIGIKVDQNNVDIVIYDNTTISENDIGILCYDSSPIILNNTIEDNEIGIRTKSGSTPEIRGNNIEGNIYFGVENVDSSVNVDAQNNWWGDATGPGGQGPGFGDEVSEYVDFIPWLTQSAF